MRFPATFAALAALITPALNAQAVPVRINFTFEGEPTATTTAPSEVGSVLARRSALRAWTDSVDVYLDQAALGARDKGWLRSRQGEAANYSVTVVALPVLGFACAKGLTAYSVVIFEPGSYNQWKYLQDYVGYGTSAQDAADGIFRAATEAINDTRTQKAR